MIENDTLTAIEGIAVGHYSDDRNLTGCTVIRFSRDGAIAGVDVRGSAPGTRETDLLSPTNMVERIHALVLTGGSAFGLDAASGVMKCLEEESIGLDTGGGILVPIVPAAVLYDLSVGNSSVRPDANWGYEACKNAESSPVQQGNIGAGKGATVGKVMGMKRAMKGGLGSFASRLPGGKTIAALTIVNAIGDVVDPRTGLILAGVRGESKGEFLDSTKLLKEQSSLTLFGGTSTTLAVIATNVYFSKTELTKIAQMAHDGLARAIRPAHTMYDGDTIFALSVPSNLKKQQLDVTITGSIAAEVLVESIILAIKSAKSLNDYPCYAEWRKD